MNSLLFVLLVLCCSAAASNFRAREIQNLEHLREELQMLHKSEEAIVSNFIDGLQTFSFKQGPKSRVLRGTSKQRSLCGQKLLNYAKSLCNATNPGTVDRSYFLLSIFSITATEMDFATKCCSYGCDDNYIRSALCPNEWSFSVGCTDLLPNRLPNFLSIFSTLSMVSEPNLFV